LFRVKGKEKPTKIFELSSSEKGLDTFASGLDAYRRQDWDAAEGAFAKCVNDDPAASTYLSRVKTLRNQNLPANWDGVWNFETK